MFNLEIDLGNAAFEDNGNGYEIKRIVSNVVDLIEAGAEFGVCWDTNGNTVGKWSIDTE